MNEVQKKQDIPGNYEVVINHDNQDPNTIYSSISQQFTKIYKNSTKEQSILERLDDLKREITALT